MRHLAILPYLLLGKDENTSEGEAEQLGRGKETLNYFRAQTEKTELISIHGPNKMLFFISYTASGFSL